MRIFAVIVGLLLVAGCDGPGVTSNNGRGTSSVRPSLESAAASGATSIHFAADAAFAWDRVYVFGSYTSRQDVEKSLGFPWPDYEKSAVQVQDGNALVVFVRGGRVVDWFDSPPGIELCWIADAKGYAREQATFRIERVDGRVDLKPLAPTSAPAGQG
jgi:hypothetical protein